MRPRFAFHSGRVKAVRALIQNGEYAKDFILENKAGNPTLTARRSLLQRHQIEVVGERLRGMMPWIQAGALVDKSIN
ncbi:hypothetical protein [Pseudomonas asiatica]|uniref:hypothetical protein n=1 Tax=Pseudomonas asiatica TaxID=2219225 RepID=UPI003877FAFA